MAAAYANLQITNLKHREEEESIARDDPDKELYSQYNHTTRIVSLLIYIS